jgi:hypothetical protein
VACARTVGIRRREWNSNRALAFLGGRPEPTAERGNQPLEEGMGKKSTGVAAGNSEAIRIYERLEEERQQKVQAKAEASKPKKVTLPKLRFLDRK